MSAQWFHDDEFDTPLPVWLADECRQFYGAGEIGRNFAQCLASFLAAKDLHVTPAPPLPAPDVTRQYAYACVRCHVQGNAARDFPSVCRGGSAVHTIVRLESL